MLTKTKMALAAALILGTASAALAENDRDEGGGFMIQGSMDGVNPVYHPDIFGNAGSAYASGVLAPTKRAALGRDGCDPDPGSGLQRRRRQRLLRRQVLTENEPPHALGRGNFPFGASLSSYGRLSSRPFSFGFFPRAPCRPAYSSLQKVVSCSQPNNTFQEFPGCVLKPRNHTEP